MREKPYGRQSQGCPFALADRTIACHFFFVCRTILEAASGFDTPHRNYCFIPYERRENCLAHFCFSRPSEFSPYCSPASYIVSMSFLRPTSRCPPVSTASAKCATTPTPRSIARSSPHPPKLSPPSLLFAPPPSYNYRGPCVCHVLYFRIHKH